jgi:threonine/homoserine/homoserine lactone efflux protein
VVLGFLLKGLLLGFSIAAPVGPIGVLCIRRTLSQGRASGLVSGLGAATADALYGCVAGFGLTLVSSLILGLRPWLSLVGGGFLCYLGMRTALSHPAQGTATAQGSGLLLSYASTLVLTLTNPMTILSFAATFAGLGVAQVGDYGAAGSLVLGVFLGSAAWWLLLSTGVGLFQRRIGDRFMLWLNRVSGAVLLGFGLWSLWSLIRRPGGGG